MSSEEWKDVVGYEGLFQVSNTGLVRSLGNGGNEAYRKGRVLKGVVSYQGYVRVGLRVIYQIAVKGCIANLTGISGNLKNNNHLYDEQKFIDSRTWQSDCLKKNY